MTDYGELVKRLQQHAENIHAENMYVDSLNEAADALDAQAKEIAELEEENVTLREALKPLLLAVEDLLIYVELPRDAHKHWLALERAARAALKGEQK
jgi:hypothetical protein